MSNEKGFTLIELLGGLVLFSLITISAVSITAQALQQNDIAEQDNSLRNDAAYVTQVLRNAYENGTLNNVCLVDGYNLESPDGAKIDLHLTGDNTLTNIEFQYPEAENTQPECFNSQSEVQTLQVNFTISNQEDETFDVDTAFTKPTTDELSIAISQPTPPDNGNDDSDDDEEPGDSTNPGDNTEDPGNDTDNPEKPGNPGDNENETTPGDSEEDTPPDTDEPYEPEEPSDPTTNIPDGCDYYGDTKLADSQFGDWKYCPIINIHQGSLWIPMSTSIFIQFNIDHNFYVTGDLVGQQNAVINAKDDSFIKNNVNLHSQNVFTGRNLTAGGTFILDTNSSVNQKES